MIREEYDGSSHVTSKSRVSHLSNVNESIEVTAWGKKTTTT